MAVSWFETNGSTSANHHGVTYSDNRVQSQPNMLAFGFAIGLHPWGKPLVQGVHQRIYITDAGIVQANTISGAVVGLAVDGAEMGSVGANTLFDHQGTAGMKGCSTSTNLTAGHFGSTNIASMETAAPLVWDDEQGNTEIGCHVPPQE